MLLAIVSPAWGASRVPQLAEDGATTRYLPATSRLAVPATQVCGKNAKWVRIGFSELTLGAYDSLVLESDGGDRYVFEGNHWKGRAFYSRALRGNCVDIHPSFGHSDSRYTVESYQFGTAALEGSPVVAAGAGDICDSTPADCGRTSDLIVAINPTVVFTTGDNAYNSGTLAEFNTRYAPRWGRFKELTNPTPGNHDYLTAGASGYFDYFNGVGRQTGPAGDRSRGYYSFDVGEWHFIALNSMSSGTVSSTQLAWLDSDLAANTKPCTAAFFHHPMVSRGVYNGSASMKPAYDRLYAAGVDLVLVGHDHNYQRYAKMTPSQVASSDGLRQVIVGTGGRDLYALNGTHPLLQAAQADTWGVLKLELTADGYTGEFVPVVGKNWTDSFSGTCNNAASENAPPLADFSFAAQGLSVDFTDDSTDADGTIASRSWNFGDGQSATSTNPNHAYATAGTYTVTLTVTDDEGATDSVSRSVTVSSPAANTPPTASFGYWVRGRQVVFKNYSTDSDGTLVTHAWDFGDGTSSTSATPSHTYATLGLWTVRLTVTDDDGAQRSVTRNVPTLNLTGTVDESTGTVNVDLRWVGAQTSSVDIFRNNTRATVTANDGAYLDATGLSGSGTLTYRVCEASRAVCTQTITLTY
ncbi:PKD domain-containing protein [Lysobacter sp. Root494]|uniref:PKD domain-containing protein n=1 Tax=Lysobacter sp. Root494 TaxID=1736549 RepID=UPI001F363F4A|nr:PKD domain-containing protein [Lysobacter sp. Root494]